MGCRAACRGIRRPRCGCRLTKGTSHRRLKALRHSQVAHVQRGQRLRIQRDRFTVAKYAVGWPLGARDLAFFVNETSPFRKINRVNAQPLVDWIRQRHAHGVALHHVADTRRYGSQEIAKLQIRDDGVVQIQQELQALVIAPQFRVGSLRVGRIDWLRRLRRDLGGRIHAILEMQFTAIRDRLVCHQPAEFAS